SPSEASFCPTVTQFSLPHRILRSVRSSNWLLVFARYSLRFFRHTYRRENSCTPRRTPSAESPSSASNNCPTLASTFLHSQICRRRSLRAYDDAVRAWLGFSGRGHRGCGGPG